MSFESSTSDSIAATPARVNPADDPIAQYRSERFVTSPSQAEEDQAQLERLGYGGLTIADDSSSAPETFALSDQNVNPYVLSLDSPEVRTFKQRLLQGISDANSGPDSLMPMEQGGMALGPYRLDAESILSWAANMGPEELAALPSLLGDQKQVNAVAGLNRLAQGYRDGLTPKEAQTQYATTVNDPAVIAFMDALKTLASGDPSASGEELATILNANLQELIAGDMIRAAFQIAITERENTIQPDSNSQHIGPDDLASTSQLDAAVLAQNAQILPGPLQGTEAKF